MKKYCLFFVLSLLAVGVRCQTNVSGFINANTTWNLAGSPYIVVGNALVSIGYTLTIDAGVVVKFDTNCALQIDGELIAIGTASNRITFTSNQPTPHAGDWAKLHIADNSVDAVYDSQGHYLSGTILKYCDVLYAGSLGNGAVHIESASPYISQCTVQHSMASGIYCAGSSYRLDSSLVNDCVSYGLYFERINLNSCGLIIQNDTIENNKKCGLYVNDPPGCITIIENNYFISNAYFGAIIFPNGIDSAKINANYFLRNISNGNNNHSGIVTFPSGYGNVTVSENYFINDTITSSAYSGILTMRYAYNTSHDTVECNTFLNNETGANDYGTIYIYANSGNELIKNNIINGNNNSNVNGYSVSYIDANNSGGTMFFSNNTIFNNTALLGGCCYFRPNLATHNELLYIEYNEFKNNISQNVIYLDGPVTNNSNYDFLYMKHNNFLDSTNHIELFNHIPYGSPNIIADSNYWGSTSTQHIDSIIYDYFDFANYSVVYYQPILTQAVEIDTSCSLGVPTTIVRALKNNSNSFPYPNPFSTYTQITFPHELKDASLLLYNVFGQQVRKMEHLSGNSIRIDKEKLPEGIYIYEVVEKETRIGNGKLVVE